MPLLQNLQHLLSSLMDTACTTNCVLSPLPLGSYSTCTSSHFAAALVPCGSIPCLPAFTLFSCANFSRASSSPAPTPASIPTAYTTSCSCTYVAHPRGLLNNPYTNTCGRPQQASSRCVRGSWGGSGGVGMSTLSQVLVACVIVVAWVGVASC